MQRMRSRTSRDVGADALLFRGKHIEIEERVAERTADGETASINAKLEMLQFRSPPGA